MKGINIAWTNEGLNEIGYDANTGKEYIYVSEKYFRPTEVNSLKGNAQLARKELKWKPKYNIASLIKEMIEQEYK